MIRTGRAVRVLEQPVPAPPEVVRAFLADPENIPRIHPLVFRIEVTSRQAEAGVDAVDFTLDERVPLGPLRVPNHYHGRIERRDAAPRELFVRGASRPAIEVEAHFAFAPDGAGSWVRETLTVTAPRPLLAFVARTAHAAHRAQLAALATVF